MMSSMICTTHPILFGDKMNAGHVAHMGESRGIYRVLVGNPRERDHFRALVRFPVCFLSMAVGQIELTWVQNGPVRFVKNIAY